MINIDIKLKFLFQLFLLHAQLIKFLFTIKILFFFYYFNKLINLKLLLFITSIQKEFICFLIITKKTRY